VFSRACLHWLNLAYAFRTDCLCFFCFELLLNYACLLVDLWYTKKIIISHRLGLQQNVKLTGSPAGILYSVAVFGETPWTTPLVAPVFLCPVCSALSVVSVVELKWELAAFVVFRHKRT